MSERELCRHCGAPTGALAEARQQLIEAAFRYALATVPNGHPVDADFRRLVSELTHHTQDDLREDVGQPGVDELRYLPSDNRKASGVILRPWRAH